MTPQNSNGPQKVPYETRPEGTMATLMEISLLHQQSVPYYRQASEQLEGSNGKASAYFKDLADYHENAQAALNEKLSDMSAGVSTPSHDSFPYLKEHENDFIRAANAKNVSQLAQLAYQNENGISDAYRHALGNRKVDDFAEQLLHDQHEAVLEWVNRADRYKTVPQDEMKKPDGNGVSAKHDTTE